MNEMTMIFFFFFVEKAKVRNWRSFGGGAFGGRGDGQGAQFGGLRLGKSVPVKVFGLEMLEKVEKTDGNWPRYGDE
jgi:hypothetical protein